MIRKKAKSLTTETLDEAVETILNGMDNMLKDEREFNFKTFATKADLKEIATKDDLKREISWVKDDIKGLTEELSSSPSRQEFNQLKGKVDKYLVS